MNKALSSQPALWFINHFRTFSFLVCFRVSLRSLVPPRQNVRTEIDVANLKVNNICSALVFQFNKFYYHRIQSAAK